MKALADRAAVLLRPDRLTIWGLTAAFLAMAAVGGLVVSTGNVILIALALGGMTGVALLGMPAITLTLILVGALVLSGPLAFYVQALDKLPWLFAILGFLLAGSALIHAGLHRRDTPTPLFVTLAVCFVVYAAASTAWADVPLAEAVKGLKRQLQYWGVLFAVAVVAFPARTVRAWVLLLLGITLVQAPMSVYQRFVLVPSMEGEPIDAVVGTLELSQIGTGASGVLALMQVCAIAALACAWRERLLRAPALAAGLVLVFVPLLVGEVNVIFLWIPLALLVVFADQLLANPLRFVAGFVAGAAALVAFGSAYLVWQQTGSHTAEPVDERIETILEYNIGETGYSNKTGLNRKTVYQHWWKQHGFQDPRATVFGHGVGSAFSAEDGRSAVSLRQGGLDLDLVSASSVLWDFGLVGLALYLGVFAAAAAHAWRLARTARPGLERALARSALAATVLAASSLVYSNAMVMMPSQQVLVFSMLGFIAWLARARPRAR